MKISDNVKKLLIVVLSVIGIAAVIWFFGPKLLKCCIYLFGILSPFIFGYAFSRLLNPLANRLQKWLKLPRMAAAVIVIIITVAALIAIIGGLGYKLFDEVRNFCYNWPEILSSLRGNWARISLQLNNLYGTMPQSVQLMLDRLGDNISAQAMAFVADVQILNNAQSFAKSLPAGIIWTIVFILALFFNVTRYNQVGRSIKKILGEERIDKLREILQGCRRYLGGYVKAQIILMFIIFAVISVILSVFGAPYALVVAAITAFLDALPFFGSGITLWPLSVIYFMSGQLRLGFIYIITYLVIVFIRRVLEPKLVSDSMGFNPLITLLAMYVAYRWWGISGLIIGPILLIILTSLYEVKLFDKPIGLIRQILVFLWREIKLFGKYIDNITK